MSPLDHSSAPATAPAYTPTYTYDDYDRAFVKQRVAQFRDQVARRLRGEITEEEFKPLRLMNGVYLQLHAYMLRVAIPYGTLNPSQMRVLARIAEVYDKGYGHFTTRQNIQYNWIKLAEMPDLLDELADVDMHAIQTSGNCIRNVTSDQYAGAVSDEIDDPRIYGELIRQWSSLHPEFSFLPRKFKIAITGSPSDRAAVKVHDIGLRMHYNDAGEPGFEVLAGGGLGRTPMIAKTVRDWVSAKELLPYLDAIMRVYNFHGRRDNKYKARIKILVHELGIEKFRDQVEVEYARMDKALGRLGNQEAERIRTHFAPPPFEDLSDSNAAFEQAQRENRDFADWVHVNVKPHKRDGYGIANISLKPAGGIPGDATADQMRVVADLAEQYGFGDIRVAHEQNLVLPHIALRDMHAVWNALVKAGLATANLNLTGDIIACPGLDYCALANARSIPIAQEISQRFEDLRRQIDIGELHINISGCINACGHHHVGHIGILGVDKKGKETYQILIGGNADEDASIGKIIGPALRGDQVADAIEALVGVYLVRRTQNERFIDTARRIGPEPFKETLHAFDA